MKLLVISSLLAIISAANAAKIVFCYYGTWSSTRPGQGQFLPSNINPHICTHIGYTFFGVMWDGSITSLAPTYDYTQGFIRQVTDLKKQNPNLKVIAVVGGDGQGSVGYSNIAADAGKRRTFINSALDLIQKNNFDGLDLDWEYPAQRGGAASDKQNFVTWLRELQTELKKRNKSFSIAVGASPNIAGPSYDIANVAKNVDFINLMTYDLHGSWEATTGQNAPLYDDGPFSVDKSVNYWLQNGAPSSKLVLGLPLYGRTWTLASGNTGTGAPANGAGQAGPFTQTGGFLGYNEICSDKSWRVTWDNSRKVPYAVKGNQWLGFDNVQSIQEKSNYALNKNLGGVMFWSIETDDFRGACGAGSFPLVTKAYNTVANR